MNRLLFISFLFVFCTYATGKDTRSEKIIKPKRIVSENYQLIIPKRQEGLLILFPCFPCDASNTSMEFNIAEIASKNNITVMMMNFNRSLWLSDSEKKSLERIITDGIKQNKLNADNAFIGGFSSGGNVALLLTDYLKATKSSFQPKGLFIVDSPIDLLGLYENAQKNIAKNFSEPSVQEANWIVKLFDQEFGTGESSIANYEAKSPYIHKTNSTQNLSNLKDVKMRFYSEPDTDWWMENRRTEYEDMNAFYIEQLSIKLKEKYGDDHVSYITTKNRGYRINGDRHPHSWSIVDKQALIDWILSE